MSSTSAPNQAHAHSQQPSPIPAALSPDLAESQGLLRSVELSGPAGRLEAILNVGAPRAPFAAIICHPHPLGGGTLHNKVVYHAMKVLNHPDWGFNWPVLRFNFRGTGLSEGHHDGQAEFADVLAALDWIENEFDRPAIVVGFSFGAAMVLKACCDSGRRLSNVRALVALGLPTETDSRSFSYHFLKNSTRPKLFLSGDHDQFAPAVQLIKLIASTAEPKKLALLPGTDHFFTGQLEIMQKTLAGWLKEQLP